MKKAIYVTLIAGSSLMLLAGCAWAPADKQAVTKAPSQSSTAGKATESAAADQPTPKPAHSESPTAPSKTQAAPLESPTASSETPAATSAKPAADANPLSSGKSAPGTETASKPAAAAGNEQTNGDAPVTPQETPAPVEAATAAPTAASPADPTAASPEAPTVTASLAASPAGETSDQIKAKYKAQLTDMESYYLGQMQKLYDQAIEAKRSGKSKGDIYNAYSQQVIDLEESSQAKVNELLLQMKNELTTGNLPTDSVNELRTTYYSELSKVQQSFTAKAKADFGI